MNPLIDSTREANDAKPRSRGDEPYQTLARAKQASKTPLTRG